ncbi:MAG: hypothetical protein COU69_00400 [Candidatus Pacebacteria bacterium CG10_big_fil_rev_8_21_14_0_10_56_10]|nr:MAG: hypothetical protein COU69_00400 [Candidatus Pacebacteria bacterium CG10_big_fil_rev_8_21_14_0_10_56_10]
MIVNHAHSHHPSRAVFYRSIVDWSRVDAMVSRLPLDQRPEVLELVMSCLDHAVMECVFHRLDVDRHHTFLVLCQDRYHDEGLLEWLKQHIDDIESELSSIIDRTKTQIDQVLE